MANHLTASEAAARLGIKRSTLYAYVSRGLIGRTPSADGRTSLYDASEVERLRDGRRPRASEQILPVVASSITTSDANGHWYRGQRVLDLVDFDVDFEHVADLLWMSVETDHTDSDHENHAQLQYPRVDESWSLPAGWAGAVHEAQLALPPETPLLDRFRVTAAVLSALDPLRYDLSPSALRRAARHLLLADVSALHKRHLGPRDRIADQLWLALAPQAGSDVQRQSLNAALVLLADHDLSPTTFVVRISASLRADPYSIVSTGLGAAGGLLFETASEAVHDLLDRAERSGVHRVLGQRIALKTPLPGIGHCQYPDGDPRERALLDLLRMAWADDPRLEIVEETRELIVERLDEQPNIDFALGALTWLARMDPNAGQMVAIARTAGWIAHAIEELNEVPHRFQLAFTPPYPEGQDTWA